MIDVGGNVVSPGFIDVHTHAGREIFQVPTADNYIRQGVTTIMEGADGGGPSMAGSLKETIAIGELSLACSACMCARRASLLWRTRFGR